VTGTLVILAAYANSLLLVERLFTIVKPKLMTLGWFVRVWTRIVYLRVVRWLGAVRVWVSGLFSSGTGVCSQTVHSGTRTVPTFTLSLRGTTRLSDRLSQLA
jgi:hypothetical protein